MQPSPAMKKYFPSRRVWLRTLVLLGGLFYTFTGAGLLFAPEWFFSNVGTFPPFNRHYMGDLGSFLLPLGVGLLIATRDPLRHRSLILVTAIGSLLHAINHVYDAILLGAEITHWLTNTLPLLIYGIALTFVVIERRR